MAEHDPHSSFIKTPQQLIVVILLSFLIPVIGIIMLVQLVVSKPSVDPNALTAESVAARLQPVGRVEFGAPAAPPGARTGETVVKSVCAACHQAGVANAPRIGDAKTWADPIQRGLQSMVAAVVKGKGAMPPKGGDTTLTDEEITRAVVHMANQSGGKFKEPPAPKQPAKPAAPQQQAQAPAAAAAPAPAPAPAAPAAQAQAQAPAAKPAAGDGKAVYDKVCVACHAQSVAGSPRLGDKAAWAPRIQQGIDTLVASVLKGKGAMPPKAGNPALTDAEARAAVEFMVSQSK